MVSDTTRNIAEQAKRIFEQELRVKLESESWGKYVAIEPESHDYFVADSFGGSVEASQKAHPNRLSFVLRVGYPAAIHIGAATT